MKEARASKPLSDSSRYIMSEADRSQYADEVTTFRIKTRSGSLWLTPEVYRNTTMNS